jgi:pyruvyltransferase
MTINAYWWRPTRPFPEPIREAVKHGAAWARLLRAQPNMSNFGDQVNAHIIPLLFGEPVKWTTIERADLVCIGSLVNSYVRSGSKAVVFGSGVRSPTTLGHVSSSMRSRVLAVRGHMSAEVLGLPASAAVGDPGLLIGELIGVKRRGAGGTLVVPHFAALGDARSRRAVDALRTLGARVVPPNTHPLEMAAEIASADIVLTSSLHALVFADGLGVPCQLVSFPGATEPTFKYTDYQSVFPAGLQMPLKPVAEILESAAPIRDARASTERRTSDVRDSLPKLIDNIRRTADGFAEMSAI